MKTINKLRNIGIMAHVDAGKTTMTERMLFYTGHIRKMGNVDDGNTVTDTDPQEEKRGITISSAAISTQWQVDNEQYEINIIDTPGHVDFAIEVERSLRVLDGAVALFCASSGVEPQSENNWHLASKYRIPRLCFVNKMDRVGADFYKVLEAIQNQLGANAIAVQLPIGAGDDFEGVIDLVTMKAIYWTNIEGTEWVEEVIPEVHVETAQRYRQFLFEALAEKDDVFLEAYLSGEPLTIHLNETALKRCTLHMDLFPVLCGTAYKNRGVQPLLNAVVRYLPAPDELETIKAEYPYNEAEVLVERSKDGPFTALVFKVLTDQHRGKLAFVRVYAGQLDPGTTVLNNRTGQKVRVNRILKIKANETAPLENVEAGTICALLGLKNVRTGDTLSAIDFPVVLESITVPEPVIGVAIEPKTKQDQKKLAQVLAGLTEEDPSLKVEVDAETGQTILKGMGELHLEVTIEKIRLTYQIELNKGRPSVAYRETIAQPVEFREKLVKQTGGSGQFADITFRMEPVNGEEKGLLFSDETKGGVIPREYLPSIQKGFLSAMQNGVLGGYPFEGLKVTLLDGAIHQTDSHAQDFEIAARNGFRNACLQARPQLLEPIMRVEIETPNDFTGAVNGDINRRRGVVTGLDNRGNRQIVKAEIPLANTFGYISDLRTLTSGRTNVSMALERYALMPDQLAKAVLG